MTALYVMALVLMIGMGFVPLGWAVLKFIPLNLTGIEKLIFAMSIGIILFTVECFLLSNVGLFTFFKYIVVIQSLLLIIFLGKQGLPNLRIVPIKVNLAAIFLILFSTYCASMLVYPFGEIKEGVLPMYGAHFVDNTWHLSLIQALQNSVPPENPLFYGTPLKQYHYFVDLQIAAIQDITRIPLPFLFFKLMGPLYFVLFAALVYLFVKRISNPFGGVMAVLLTTVSSNAYYIANIFFPSSRHIPSIAWVDLYSSKSVNYPLAFSLICFLVVIYITVFAKKVNAILVILLSVVLGSLFGIKSHTAVVLLGSYGIFSLYQAFKREYIFLLISLCATLISFWVLSRTLSPGDNGLLVSPFWFIRTMYASPDHLNNDTWELKRQYLLENPGYLGLIKLYSQGWVTFMLINLGILALGIITVFLPRQTAWENRLNFLLIGVIAVSISLTMLLIYRHTANVTIQFFYPTIVALALLISIALGKLFEWKNSVWAIVISIVMWMTLLPGVYYTLSDYQSGANAREISSDTLEGIEFLSQLGGDRVFADLRFFPGSVLPAYSGKSMYVGDDWILEGLGVDTRHRRRMVEEVFGCFDESRAYAILEQSQADWVVAKGIVSCFNNYPFLQSVFGNEEITIYQYSRYNINLEQ